MLRAHSMVHAAMFALHWEAFERWLVNDGKDLEFMSTLACNLQLLLDAVSESDAEKAQSACADATDQLKESHLSFNDRQRSRSLIGVDTEPQQPQSLAEPLDQLSTLWHLTHLSPTVLLEGLAPSSTLPTWSAFQAILIPRCLPPTVISYGPFFPQSPTNPDVVEKSVEYCMEVAQKMDQEFTIIT